MPSVSIARPPNFEVSRQKYQNIQPKGWKEPPVPVGKVREHGIEVNEQLLWQKWEPGREYTKNIVLKNLKVKTEKIKYHVPSSRFFTTLYPKAIVLSAGTSFTLPVTFRPLEKNVYQDKIVFQTKEGTFEVALHAILPQVDITVPDGLEFPMCAACDTVHVSFDVKNSGDLPTTFQWDVPDPFVIEPMEATIQPRSSCTVKAIFRPKGAVVYDAEVLCRYGPEFACHETMRLQGIGKFPHILVSAPGQLTSCLDKSNLEAEIDFGSVPIGETMERWVELHNLSPVNAPFTVEHPLGVNRIDKVFESPQLHGVVPAMSIARIPLIYSPNTVDCTNIDYFHVIAIGNVSKSVIKCLGSSRGPSIQLGSKLVNFMQINIGETATRTVDIINDTDTEAVLQLMIDCAESVFKFGETCIAMKPFTKRTIIVKFTPLHPINHYRRITCLVHNQGPLFLDLLGTCHSEMVKPAVLLGKHIDRYRTHVQRGVSMYSPEQLNEMIHDNKLEIDSSGAIVMNQEEGHHGIDLRSIPPMDEYFNDGFHCDVVQTVPHVSLDTDKADFGVCHNLRIIEDKTINVTNHTQGKMTVQWNGGSDRTFFVTPSSIDIPPQKTCTFQVSFKPTAPNQFYGAELECYAYYKSLRDYRLVEDTTHTPPWCMTLTCTGHTFMPTHETFLPRYTLDTSQLVFPAVNANESAYRTVLLTNTGTTPILFDVEKDTSEIFSVKPSKALIKGGHQVFVVKTVPAEVKSYEQHLQLRLNDDDKHSQELELLSSAESAEVLLECDGVMFFKPTCLGTACVRSYSVKNISRIPLRFEWKMCHADAQLLTVNPETGIIQPNEYVSQEWSFMPKTEQKYVMKPALIVWGQGQSSKSSGGKRRQFLVRSVGEGTLGEIKCEESYVNFGDVVIGNASSRQIVIHNSSTCSLYYSLHVEQTIDSPDETTQHDLPALSLDVRRGILPARSRQLITATIRPVRRSTYQFAISYKLLTPEGKPDHSTPDEPQYLCHMLATGVFPTMTITDARCLGSAIGISKKQLWSLFSLDNFNICLDADPASKELLYSTSTRHSHQRRPPVYTRAILDFNFSAAPLGSEPCIVSLLVENTGTVPTDWSFLFPSDLQLELEFWAETGEFDDDELHEMKVMDNQLFSVEPKKGKLEPGESTTVTMTYYHTMAGTDRIPVLLKLANGREILLNFIGVTVDPERRYIHFPANKHLFAPVPVGEKVSPKQIYEIYNGGAVPVKYEFDLMPLEILCKENFDQPILECLNPQGEVAPGRTAQIEWRFSPVEAKTYMVDVPIRVDKGDTAVITFTGVGYDKRVMGDTMPMTDQPELTGVPSIQSVPIPGQLVYLSQERVSLGNLPLFSQARRMVSVTNRSKDHRISYEWHITSKLDRQVLSIYPVRGKLEPGESEMCRVNFTACGLPSFYDLDLVCEVTDETDLGVYKVKLSEWETEKDRQRYEFTITESDPDADMRSGMDMEVTDRPRSGQLCSLEEARKKQDSDADLTKYKTLPPIQTISADQVKQMKTAAKKIDVALWEKPVPPAPFLLHLGVTTRTHDVREFQDNFPEEYRNYYIDRALSERYSEGSEKKPSEQQTSTPSQIGCCEAEGEVISGVLSNILRGLMDDTYFHEAVQKISKEPVPYFSQFSRRPPTAPPSLGGNTKAITPTSIERPVSVGSLVDRLSERSEDERSLPERTVGGYTPKVSSPTTPPPPPATPPVSPQESHPELKKAFRFEKQNQEKQDLKKLPEFGNLTELLMENTLMNIMSEALSREFTITAKPRFIALPKKPGSGGSRSSKI